MEDSTNALYFYAGYLIGRYKEQDETLDRKKQLFNDVELSFTRHLDRAEAEQECFSTLLSIIKKYKPFMAYLFYKITEEKKFVCLCEVQLYQEKVDNNWIEYKGEQNGLYNK
jgi:membrane-anchored protein YejM (alkaline phosphatase superfamily)